MLYFLDKVTAPLSQQTTHLSALLLARPSLYSVPLRNACPLYLRRVNVLAPVYHRKCRSGFYILPLELHVIRMRLILLRFCI